MRAIAQSRYGPPADVLALQDVPDPAVGGDAVLVGVRAASVNAADWHLVRGAPYISRLSFGLRAPKHPVPGCDLAGVVEAVGPEVTRFAVGDEVYGTAFLRGFGAFAERAAVAEELLAAKPASLSFEEASALPLAGQTALQALRDHSAVTAGRRVLVIGASGGVGSLAVQIAVALGAEVTGVCSTRNVELVRSLGAAHVVDYTREKPAGPFDVVLQLAGAASAGELRPLLTENGTILLLSGESSGRWIGALGRALKGQLLSPLISQKVGSFTVRPNAADLDHLTALCERGDLRAVVEERYALDDAPAAIRRLEQGHVRGKLVVTVPA
jgi:NADPH:quinone reductase-like Zn-dependent oxidoreductase